MKTGNFKFLMIAGAMVVGMASFTGCSQEGCTNASDINYDADAEEDDGSCDPSATTAQFTGNWVLSENCDLSGTDTYSLTIATSALADYTLNIGNFWNAFTNTVTATVSGTNLTIANQDPDNDGYTVSGSGTVSGNTMTLSFTISDGTDTNTCTATLAK